MSAAERERIARWLTLRIAQKRALPEHAVGLSQPFTELGLASLELVSLAVEVGVWLGREVDTTLLFNHPDIDQVAAFLAEPQDAASSAQTPVPRQEPLAIVGMACRFPGAASLDEFWRLLEAGEEAIRDVPPSRWDVEAHYDAEPMPGKTYTRRAGFVDGIDEFDAAFFGISAREARVLDPQHRLVLMTTWHAVENAGIPPARLAGTRTGVFVGIGVSDYYGLMEVAGVHRDAYFATGISPSIAANRISYLLDLRGPSLAIDTTCSSSLVAVHQARTSLLSGESDCAIVASVNVIACPGGMVALSQGRMLSPTGRCHTFDAAADGYVRGEGCGAVVLKRYSDALRDNDRIHALIAGSAVNQDGRSAGLMVPNGEAQRALMQQALAAAGVSADRVGYLEAHGTGTPLGDPIEMGAIKQVYGAASEHEPVLHIGSVKTNVGHLEAAAGMAGLFKVVLSLRHQSIPPHRNFKRLNPHISLAGTRCAITTETQGWVMSLKPRYAAISSFGIGGTNAHLIVQDAPATELLQAPADDAQSWQALLLSAKDAASLVEHARRHAVFLMSDAAAGWPALCATAALHRAHHAHRVAVLAPGKAEAAQTLQRWLDGERPADALAGVAKGRQAGKLAFVFTGQGAQYVGMGRTLYRQHVGFRAAVERCEAALLACGGTSLVAMLYPTDDSSGVDLAQTLHAQPTLFALEYALAQVWLSAGVRPDALLGHSLGEYVAACIAGVFSLEDALTLVAHRARLMQDESPPGAMSAVQASVEQVERMVAELASSASPCVALAARNAPDEIVVSGDEAAIDVLLARWSAEGASVTRLQVTRAFHSPLMNEMAMEFERVAQGISYRAPSMPLVSNVTGAVAGDEIATARYWARHVLAPVRFAEGIETLRALGCDAFVEIGPHPVLTAYVKRIAPDVQAVPSLRRGQDDERCLLEALAGRHVLGDQIDWAGWFRAQPSAVAVSLPAYPFRRERHWFTDEHVAAPSPVRAAVPSHAAREDAALAALRAQPLDDAEAALPAIEDYLFRRLAAVMRMSEWQQAECRPRFASAGLSELGLDSLMGVELRQTVQNELGVRLPVRQLLDGTPVDALARLIVAELVRTKGAAFVARQLPPLVEDRARRFEPFTLSPLGQASWAAAGDGLPNELYAEVELDGEVEQLEAGWQEVIACHDMLRAVVQEDGMLRVLAEVPPYRIATEDLGSLSEDERGVALLRTRQAMTEGVLAPQRWPMFEIRSSRLGAGRVRLHLRFSVLIVDTQSFALLAQDWDRSSRGERMTEPPAPSYRDYRCSLQRAGEGNAPHVTGPPAPAPAIEQALERHVRYAGLCAELDALLWTAFQRRAKSHGLTSSAALMAAYAVVLGRWSECAAFSIGVVTSSRLPIHPRVQEIVGDFAGLVPVTAHADASFADLAAALQAQLVEGLELLESGEVTGPFEDAAPFLFNSMLHAVNDEAAAAPGADRFGPVLYSLTRGAGTRVEMQAVEVGGSLHFNWDARVSSFPPGLPESMFTALDDLLRQMACDDGPWGQEAPPALEAVA